MNAINVDVTTPYVGGDCSLEPISLTVTSSIASPAKSMRGVFAIPDFPPECLRVKVRRGERLLMDGKIDRQRATVSEDGITLELEARDKGALLLDNEARPKAYQDLTVNRMFQEQISQHGFVLVPTVNTSTISAFTVRKGQSIWDAFVTLTRLCSGYVPYVSGDMVIVGNPAAGAARLLGGSDYPITSLTHTISHYKVLSQVYIRDSDGAYPTMVTNPSAVSKGISRTRYYIPAGEYYCLPSWDANQRIRRSIREMEEVTVTLPGILEINPGESVAIEHKLAVVYNLMADEVVHSLGQGGETTRLTLKSWLYF